MHSRGDWSTSVAVALVEVLQQVVELGSSCRQPVHQRWVWAAGCSSRAGHSVVEDKG